MATRVTSSRFVGRAAELAELEAALSDAVAGRPRLAFVAGESGVGKTRLLTELERRAAERHGARVIGGDCVELGEGELPYAPIVGALRGLAREDDPVLAGLPAPIRRELAALVPALAREGEPAIESDQARLFEALLALLETMAAERALVLSIEDLHWADRSTRAFLAFLAASLCGVRVLVVCTYRPDELHRRHPLRPVLAELERDKRARRIDVVALTRTELAEQLEDILGAPAKHGLIERLWTRSEGNPLFTEELLAAGLDGRGDVPPNLRDALMLRVERLSEPAQHLLRLLSAGRRLDHGLLADASGLETGELRDALREAVASHILVADAEGFYAFRHALLREVVHDDLLPGEHAELHQALARALERRAEEQGDGAHLAAGIAHHYLAAGDQPAALAASVRAGLAAQKVHAYGEAAGLFDRALELWDRVADPEQLAGRDRVEMLILAGNAAEMQGDSARAEPVLRRALELVDERECPRLAARVLERLQRAEWSINRQEQSIATIDHALSLLDPDEASTERATLLASQAKSLMLRSRYNRAAEVAREALSVAKAVGDERSIGRARDALGVSLMALGDVDAGVEQLRHALDEARAHERVYETSIVYTNLADSLHLAGRTREALATAREGVADANYPGRAGLWLGGQLAELAFDAGEWEEAAANLPARDRRYSGTLAMHLRLRHAELALGRGEHEAARELLDESSAEAESSREPQFLGVLGALRGELERRSGDVAAARAAIDEALDRIEFCSDDVMRVARVSTVGVKIEADAAQQARDLGDADAERAACERGRALLARVQAACADGERPVELAYLRSAEAEMARAGGVDEPALWAAATAAWDALERPYLAAQTRWREAEAHAARGDREAAGAVTAQALDTARRLGAGWLTGELEGLAARARLRLGDGPGPDGGEPAGAVAAAERAEDPFGLTQRERQVLTLLAEGATNREIGARLYMAEKTASVHVSRILAKLDVRSRTQAAAVAHRLGLDGAE